MIEVNEFLQTRSENFVGADKKFWLNVMGDDYLFKYSNTFSYVGEIVCSQLFSLIGLNAVDAKYAVFRPEGKLHEGALIKSYIDKNTLETISYLKIANDSNPYMAKFRRENGEYSNTPEDAVRALFDYISFYSKDGNSYYVDYVEIKDQLNKLAIIDFLTAQCDRHRNNIEFVLKKEHGKTKVELAPFFDNGRSFGLQDIILMDCNDFENTPSQDKQKFYLDKEFRWTWNDNAIANLIHSDKRYAKFYAKIKQIDIKKLIIDIEKSQNINIPIEAKIAIITTWQNRVATIDDWLMSISQRKDYSQKRKIEELKIENCDNLENLCNPRTIAMCYLMQKNVGETVDIHACLNEAEQMLRLINKWKFDGNMKAPLPNLQNFPHLLAIKKWQDEGDTYNESVIQKMQNQYNVRLKENMFDDLMYYNLIFYQDVLNKIKPDMTLDEQIDCVRVSGCEQQIFRMHLYMWYYLGDEFARHQDICGRSFDKDVKQRFAKDIIDSKDKMYYHFREEFEEWIKREELDGPSSNNVYKNQQQNTSKKV